VTEPAAGDTTATQPSEGVQPSERAQPTGVVPVDAAAERLAGVDEAPLEEHVEIYEDVHRRLQEGLADLDEQ